MSYEYYCTHCGKRLHQTSTEHDAKLVLFDLQPVLSESVPFQMLKWRITEAEMTALFKQPSLDGFYPVKYTFAELFKCIANENNLNTPKIADLTIEDVKNYIGDRGEVIEKESRGNEAADLLGFDEIEESPANETIDEKATGKIKKSNAILALESIDTAVDDILQTEIRLKRDLEHIYNVFLNHDILSFGVKPIYEKDTEGGNVLTGYHYRRNDIVTVPQCPARVCPCCDSPIFLHAGTAKHQSVAFIGYQSSGKTSTILALTDYTKRAIGGVFVKTGIWGESAPILEIEDCEPLDINERMTADLELFRQGIAPAKTKAESRKNAYSATFRFKNRMEHKSYIITLVDLPGELCFEEGQEKPDKSGKYTYTGILKDKVLKEFQVALSCDAYIICFDTSKIRMDENAMGMIRNNCTWANEFQELRTLQPSARPYYLPMMVLFTKCAELEDCSQPLERPEGFVPPVKQTYMFYEERVQMGLDLPEKGRSGFSLIYSKAMDKFNEVGDLKRAYHSLLRSSPFGYPAPSVTILNDPTILDKPEYHPPTPKQIDKLMRWILSVCGAIPTSASYSAVIGGSAWRLMEYRLSRQQFRQENPQINDSDQEALARCALFSNPGEFDVALVEAHHSRLQRLPVTWKMMVSTQGKD